MGTSFTLFSVAFRYSGRLPVRWRVPGGWVCSGSIGRLFFGVREHGTLVFAIISQDAIEFASGVEAMIQPFGF